MDKSLRSQRVLSGCMECQRFEIVQCLLQFQEELEKQEKESFDRYLRNIYDTHPREKLNMFEHNLEVNLVCSSRLTIFSGLASIVESL